MTENRRINWHVGILRKLGKRPQLLLQKSPIYPLKNPVLLYIFTCSPPKKHIFIVWNEKQIYMCCAVPELSKKLKSLQLMQSYRIFKTPKKTTSRQQTSSLIISSLNMEILQHIASKTAIQHIITIIA